MLGRGGDVDKVVPRSGYGVLETVGMLSTAIHGKQEPPVGIANCDGHILRFGICNLHGEVPVVGVGVQFVMRN